jgi:hypothetical protein
MLTVADTLVVSDSERVEAFRFDLAALRERVGTGLRTPVEEDLQGLSNRRYHLSRDFALERKRIEAIVADHQRLSPQLRLRVLGS